MMLQLGLWKLQFEAIVEIQVEMEFLSSAYYYFSLELPRWLSG